VCVCVVICIRDCGGGLSARTEQKLPLAFHHCEVCKFCAAELVSLQNHMCVAAGRTFARHPREKGDFAETRCVTAAPAACRLIKISPFLTLEE
jgi:hypothetical protein